MKFTQGLLVLLLSAGFVCSANAAPAITGISGTVANGSTLTVTGSGFTVQSPAGVRIFDTVENQMISTGTTGTLSLASTLTSVYSLLTSGSLVPTGQGLWDSNTLDAVPVRVAKNVTRGTRTAYYYGNNSSHLDYLIPFKQNPTDTLYVSWWFKPSADPAGGGGSNKFIRVWDDSNGNGARISWTQMHLTATNTNPDGVAHWGGWGGVVGQWNHMEIWVDSPNKSIKTWVNGTLTHDLVGFEKPNNGIGLNVGLIGFDPGGNITSSTYENLQFQMSDIYVASTIARVVVSDKATWAEKGTREVQPEVNRSTGQIQVKLNQGALSSFSNAYLYVIDTGGNVNANGFRLTGAQTPVPNPPVINTVQ